MQGRVHDPGIAEAQHQIDVVHVGRGLTRHKRGMAVERDAGERDRRFVLRRGDDRIDVPGKRGPDRAADEGDGGAAALGAGGAEGERCRLRLRAVEHVQPVVRPIGIGDALDLAKRNVDAAGVSVPRDHGRVAHQDRIASVADATLACGLQADLRTDAGRITCRDRNDRFVAHVTSDRCSLPWQ